MAQDSQVFEMKKIQDALKKDLPCFPANEAFANDQNDTTHDNGEDDQNDTTHDNGGDDQNDTTHDNDENHYMIGCLSVPKPVPEFEKNG